MAESAEQLEHELLRAVLGDPSHVAVFHPHPRDVVKLGRSALWLPREPPAGRPESPRRGR